MIRRNADILPVSREVLPNGFYQLYGHLFDEIFLEKTFDFDVLKDLYIFDRYEPAREPFVPREWQKVDPVTHSELEKEFLLDPNFGYQERQLLSFLLTKLTDGKLLGIVGDVGTGKSTFIQYMFKHYIPGQPFGRDTRIWVVDISHVLQTQEKYAYHETVAAVLPEVRNAFIEADATIDDTGPWTGYQFVEYVRGEIRRLSDRRKVIIVFDNVDRFPASFQKNLAQLCDTLVEATSSTVVVALRPITIPHFVLPARAGGTPPQYLEQRPPLIEKVLQRRLEHFTKARGEFKSPHQIRIAGKSVHVSFATVERFVPNFIKLVVERRVQEALEHLSNRNVLVASMWTLDLMRAWNLNVPELIDHPGSQEVHLREHSDNFDTFITALGYSNHDMYFRSTSRLENLFSAGLMDSRHDTLIKCRCLKYCNHHPGPVQKETLLCHLRKFGYEEYEVAKAVNALLEAPRRLLQSVDGSTLAEINTVGISTAGRWYLNKILFYMRYIQIVADDMLLPEEKSLNDGSWPKRMRNLLDVLELIGEREIEEVKSFMSSGSDQNVLADEYIRVYGKGPLAVEMMNSFKHFISGGSANGEKHRHSAKVEPLGESVTKSIKNLNDQFESLTALVR